MKKQKWLAGFLLGAAIGGAACGSDDATLPSSGAPSTTSTEADSGASSGSGEGAGSPNSGGAYNDQYNFTATTFDGEVFELATFRGTPVVINFWESW